jgi:hypothetical protein
MQRTTRRSETIDRLQQSLATVLYAVSIAPETWHYQAPADDAELSWLGSWSVAQNLAHLAVYEEQVAAPILEAIAAGRDGAADVASALESDYETLWQELATCSMDEIAQRLSHARARQIDAVTAMSEERFQTPATTLWQGVGGQPGHAAAWVAAKTIQHTWEHGDSIFRIALFAPARGDVSPDAEAD